MKRIINILSVAVTISAFIGCGEKYDDDFNLINGINGDTIKVNKFVMDLVSDAYLWEDEIDWAKFEKSYTTYGDPYKLFEDMRHEDDHWSMLTDDIDGLEGEFQGTSLSFGWRIVRGRFTNSQTSFYIVLYAYPGTPADKAGIERGDIIVKIDGQDITEDNYLDLYYSTSVSVTKGIYNRETGSISVSGTTVSLNAVEMYQNPINKDTVIVKGANRIGYLCYTDFLDKSEADLIRVFSGFKSRGVTDVVLDLRYNPGGYVRTSIVLSSILAPLNTVRNRDVYQVQIWNRAYTEYYQSKGDDMKEYFTDTLPVNMELSRVFILATENSASASEATIIALEPYMDVVTVGGQTSGKFCGGGLISPANVYSDRNYYKNIANWGMYIMYFRYTNKTGKYFFTGLDPDIKAEEDYFDLKPFGDTSDPLLATAVARITGETYTSPRSASPVKSPDYRILPDTGPKKYRTGVMIGDKRLK
ncbi:MAG: hypothetical protein LBT42_09635 [Tannerella sp.]|jgi:C-terminal processing protease CtpA/Prc|nr:hypothetical protein [Tannerella sp.]